MCSSPTPTPHRITTPILYIKTTLIIIVITFIRLLQENKQRERERSREREKMNTNMREMIRYMQVLFLIIIMISTFNLNHNTIDAAEDQNLGEKCSKDLEKVAACLSFATGKAEAPTKECCSAVKDIRESDPVCLCYIIQQTHNGSKQVKSIGIQEGKIIQLPTACNLVNSSISDCPKLLNIPKTSPEYAIFTNSSSPATITTKTPTTTTTTDGGVNDASKHGPDIIGLVAITMAVVFYAFPAASPSLFCT